MASSSSRQGLTSDPTHLMKSYGVYVKSSTAHKETVKWIQEKLPDVLKRVCSNNQVPDVFNVLSIGCGEGNGGDLLVLEAVANMIRGAKPNSKPVLFNQTVDPRSDALATFQSSAQSWKEKHGNIDVSFEWAAKTWQDYDEETKQEPKKFHFISFIQSIYYMEPERTLRDCLEKRLDETGIILCINVGEDVFFNHFARKFYGTELLIMPTGANYYTSESIAAIAEKNGWKHDHFLFEFSLEVTDIFDESSVEGNLLLDFLVQTVNFRAVTNKTDEEQVIQLLSGRSKLGDDGKKRMHEKVGVVVIYKS